jgi:hypothetical protein
MNLSADRIGLYISLNQCSLSTGLVHRQAGVIVSRQTNPTPFCPRPPEPRFRMTVQWYPQTPYFWAFKPRQNNNNDA